MLGIPGGYAGFFIAMSAGWFGATFFMLALMQSNIERAEEYDVRAMWSYPMILLRCSVGVGAASILYFFFESGVLTGTLWPDLNKLGFSPVGSVEDATGAIPTETQNNSRIMVPNQHTALLIVWCFLAGYSQTLVPSILNKAEEKQAQ